MHKESTSTANGELSNSHLTEKCGADEMDTTTEDGASSAALIKACLLGQYEAVELLLHLGTDLNARENTFGATPLIYAAIAGHYNVTRLLLERGANVNACTRVGGTALLAACRQDQTDLVQLLIEYGADISVKDKRGFTPVIEAARGLLGSSQIAVGNRLQSKRHGW